MKRLALNLLIFGLLMPQALHAMTNSAALPQARRTKSEAILELGLAYLAMKYVEGLFEDRIQNLIEK